MPLLQHIRHLLDEANRGHTHLISVDNWVAMLNAEGFDAWADTVNNETIVQVWISNGHQYQFVTNFPFNCGVLRNTDGPFVIGCTALMLHL